MQMLLILNYELYIIKETQWNYLYFGSWRYEDEPVLGLRFYKNTFHKSLQCEDSNKWDSQQSFWSGT